MSKNDNKTVQMITLGCKVNQYETDGMLALLKQAGYALVKEDEQANVIVVNTCSVTNMAERKSRQMLSRAKKNSPDAIVIAAGCYVQEAAEDLLQMEDIDIVIGNNQKKSIVSILEEYEKQHTKQLDVIDINEETEFEQMHIDHTQEHTRAYVKVQDGCNQFCSYCIIPYLRGRIRSRAKEEVVKEITVLAAEGYKEVVLTGIHLSSYGKDLNEEEHLLSLIQAVHDIKGIERIRLGSLEPGIITEEFAYGIKELPKVCPHFHLSLQSGCDNTLKAMNRKYTAKEYADKCELLRKVYGNPALTTDVIVGFPGETKEDFECTSKYLQELNLYEMHIFKYSIRKGTVAATMKQQVDGKIKQERSARLLQMTKEHKSAYMQTFIGKMETVLFEEKVEIENKKYWVGYTTRYVKVAVETNLNIEHQLQDVEITGILNEDYVIGRLEQ